MARWIDGFPRHLSVHCGGVVVSPIPLTRRLSLERAAKGVAITQCDMYDVEELGLVKIDLLGNRSLGVLADAVAAVKDHTGRAARLPARADLRRRGDQRRHLRGPHAWAASTSSRPGMRSSSSACGRAHSATSRRSPPSSGPGVTESGMMEAYIARRLGGGARALRRARAGAHPAGDLRRHGLPGGRDPRGPRVRGAHAGRGGPAAPRHERQVPQPGRDGVAHGLLLRQGPRRGVGEDVLAELWWQIKSFAGYAFCKAHSASFAQLSYQVAYLKAHHPAEFFAALVNNQGGFYGTAAYVEEARRWGMDDPPARRERLGGRVRRARGASCAAGSSPCAACAPARWTPSTRSAARGPTAPCADLCSRLRKRLRPAEIEILGACGGVRFVRAEPRLVAGSPSGGEGRRAHGPTNRRKMEELRSLRVQEIERRSPRGQEPIETRQTSLTLGRISLAIASLQFFSLVDSWARGRVLNLAPRILFLPKSWPAKSARSATRRRPTPSRPCWTGRRATATRTRVICRRGPAGWWVGRGKSRRRLGPGHHLQAHPHEEDQGGHGLRHPRRPDGSYRTGLLPKGLRALRLSHHLGPAPRGRGQDENDRGGLTLTVGHAWTVRGMAVPKPVEEKAVGEGVAWRGKELSGWDFAKGAKRAAESIATHSWRLASRHAPRQRLVAGALPVTLSGDPRFPGLPATMANGGLAFP